VGDTFLAGITEIRVKYGMNILLGNKLMNNFQKSINAVQKPFKEK
jgi:hypothetical protein